MDSETHGNFGIAAGAVKEDITTRAVEFQPLGVGQQLGMGDSSFETTEPCQPCLRMDEIRQGLQQELRGQRGWLCRVLEVGRIRRGGRIQVLAMVAQSKGEEARG